MRITVIPIEVCAPGTTSRGDWKKNRNHPDNSIVEIGQSPEKSPGDLEKLAVTPLKDHWLKQVWKTWTVKSNFFMFFWHNLTINKVITKITLIAWKIKKILHCSNNFWHVNDKICYPPSAPSPPQKSKKQKKKQKKKNEQNDKKQTKMKT